jgi:hypothetical protein
MDEQRDRQSESKSYVHGRLSWLAIPIVLLMLILWVCTPSNQEREASDRKARPEYYAHIDQFGNPPSLEAVIGYVGRVGYEDLDIGCIKGPLMVPEGWLFGLVFKCHQNPNDQLWWVVQTGKHGHQDLKMYPGNKYPTIPACS